MVQLLSLGKIGPNHPPKFSVVNGAQTIIAAARFFFNLEGEVSKSDTETEMKQKLTRAKQYARVPLRVIRLPESSGHTISASKVSVALNRQKPIKMEDIAFSTPFVEKLSSYLERCAKKDSSMFLLTKRGEQLIHDQMSLVDFARARLACINKPGDARNKSGAELLRLDQGEDIEYYFKQTNVFPKEWLENLEEADDILFQRYYGAVWYAHSIAQKYDAARNNMKNLSGKTATVIQNGKWYFTAIAVQLRNDFSACLPDSKSSNFDFTAFKNTADTEAGDFPEAIYCFADLVNEYVKQSDIQDKLNSNTFKNENLYNQLLYALMRLNRPANLKTELLSAIFQNFTQQLKTVFSRPCL